MSLYNAGTRLLPTRPPSERSWTAPQTLVGPFNVHLADFIRCSCSEWCVSLSRLFVVLYIFLSFSLSFSIIVSFFPFLSSPFLLSQVFVICIIIKLNVKYFSWKCCLCILKTYSKTVSHVVTRYRENLKFQPVRLTMNRYSVKILYFVRWMLSFYCRGPRWLFMSLLRAAR